MRSPVAVRLAPVITVLAALGLPLAAQDNDRMRETVKRLETALARVESHLQAMGSAGQDASAQTSALEQAQRDQEALRVELRTRDEQLARLRTELAAQVASRQRLEDDRAAQVRDLDAKLTAATARAAQHEERLASAVAEAARGTAQLAAAQDQIARTQQEVEVARAELQKTRNAAAEAQRTAAVRLQTALDELDAARSQAATPPPTVDATSVKTSAGGVQVHHHGPGNIILNFQTAPPSPPAPARPRIEI